jgi:hypothetical protein
MAVTSNAEGVISLPGLTGGAIKILFSHTGYKTQELTVNNTGHHNSRHSHGKEGNGFREYNIGRLTREVMIR